MVTVVADAMRPSRGGEAASTRGASVGSASDRSPSAFVLRRPGRRAMFADPTCEDLRGILQSGTNMAASQHHDAPARRAGKATGEREKSEDGMKYQCPPTDSTATPSVDELSRERRGRWPS
ncbi:hypothetical protein EYF80_025569 [Liparis tanakae]|uniref:Uncharacterized protein n=1 Tax=Liparis tanakae TaxID=230148 RepID=A0A4Z2HF10_9TELE|nr:hypothetical protein EYF80_025569 [Liparis tanakae]